MSPLHLFNAKRPIEVKVLGSVREVSRLQSSNAPLPIWDNELGSTRDVSPVHPLNADSPILVMLVGSFREVSATQALNAPAPTIVMLSRSVREVSRLQPRKASSLMVCTSEGTTTASPPRHVTNAPSTIRHYVWRVRKNIQVQAYVQSDRILQNTVQR